MGEPKNHARLAKEKREAAQDEYVKGRYTVVGDLAIKAVEQAIEAIASLEGIHFHKNPKTAHARRIRWFKDRFPNLSRYIDMLWGAYGTLGYEGVDGERAKKVLNAMEVMGAHTALGMGRPPLPTPPDAGSHAHSFVAWSTVLEGRGSPPSLSRPCLLIGRLCGGHPHGMSMKKMEGGLYKVMLAATVSGSPCS